MNKIKEEEKLLENVSSTKTKHTNDADLEREYWSSKFYEKVAELAELKRKQDSVNEVNLSKTTKEIKKEIWEELDLIVRDKKISTRELFDNIMDITIRKMGGK